MAERTEKTQPQSGVLHFAGTSATATFPRNKKTPVP